MSPGPQHKGLTRRALLAGGTVAALAVVVGAKIAARRLWLSSYENGAGLPAQAPEIVKTVGKMPYRRFGATGLKVSEIGFGAWGIGSQAYGAVAREDSLRALARAEELGCNLVDTAMVYGDSERVLGEFLKGRRSRWIVATKYSYQPAGMTATLEEQLRRLGTDVIDYYQLHSMPEDDRIFEELFALKKAGKVRFVGVSLYSAHDIEPARAAAAGWHPDPLQPARSRPLPAARGQLRTGAWRSWCARAQGRLPHGQVQARRELSVRLTSATHGVPPDRHHGR